MTGNIVLDFFVSAGGAALLVGLSWAMGAWKSAAVTAETAAERLGFDEPDFGPVDWLVDRAGRAALAINPAGEMALVFAKGDKLATRRFAPHAALADLDGAVIHLKAPGDHTVHPALIDAGDPDIAAAWARKIARDYDI